VVSPEKKEVFRIFDLVGEKQADCLERLLSPVYVVAEEQVVGLGRESPVLKEAEKVGVLAVNVAWRRRKKRLL
jgi:hypothetical protein